MANLKERKEQATVVVYHCLIKALSDLYAEDPDQLQDLTPAQLVAVVRAALERAKHAELA